MAYEYSDGAGQRLILSNFGTQTSLTLASSSAGQQQQASQSFQTGSWTAAPELFQTAGGLVVKLQADRELWLQIQGGRCSQVTASAIGTAQPLTLRQIPDAQPMPPMPPMQPMPPMEPIPPMPPMQTGMSMSLEPMEMRMGNMQMRMGAASPARFCSQCGASVQPDDRFCTSCGLKLSPRPAR